PRLAASLRDVKWICGSCGFIYDPARVIPTAASLRGPRSRTSPRRGSARCAGRASATSSPTTGSGSGGPSGLLVVERAAVFDLVGLDGLGLVDLLLGLLEHDRRPRVEAHRPGDLPQDPCGGPQLLGAMRGHHAQ